MTWLTWRQLRGSVAMTAALLLILAAVLALTGPDLAARYTAGIAECTEAGTCERFYNRFFGGHELAFLAVSLVALLLPAVVGLFWGAPMITRELEAGTHLLVWNQSITRRRWLAVKLGLTVLAAAAAAGLCGLMVTWWSGPLDASASEELAPMAPLVFGARGILPVAYAAFAVVLGVTVGMLVRRTLPAMALTLAVFAGIQLAMPLAVRPYLMAPVTQTYELGEVNVDGVYVPRYGGSAVQVTLKAAVPGSPGAWVLGNELLDPSGRVVAAGDGGAAVPVSTTSGVCSPGGSAAGGGCLAEINRLGYRQQVTYHPLGRFWPFQWIEAGIYALLTLGLTGLSFRWIRRRVS
jgi:hypothetical protein